MLLVVLMFIFASYGVQLFGGKLARCNDHTIKVRVSIERIIFIEQFTVHSSLKKGSLLEVLFYIKENNLMYNCKENLSNILEYCSRNLQIL